MNRIILITAFMFLGVFAWGQKVQYYSSIDTLANSDTLAVTMPLHQDRAVDWAIHVFADSLSGSTAGTALIQHKLDDDGADWVTKATLTINGVSSSTTATGSSLGGEWRVYYVTSGSQSTAVRTWFAYVRSKD